MYTRRQNNPTSGRLLAVFGSLYPHHVRRPALLRIEAVHGAARARCAVKLSKQDRGGEHAHRRFVGGLDLGAEPSRGWSRTPLSLTLRRMLTTTRLRSAAIPVTQSLNARDCVATLRWTAPRPRGTCG